MIRREQTGIRRFFASRLFIILAFLAIFFVAAAYIRAYYQDYKVRQEIKTLQEEVKKLEKKKLESMEILKYVISPEFVEEKARTELNMKKPGENVLVISSSSQEQETAEKAEQAKPLLKNPVKWWYYFTHRQIKAD